MSSDPKQSSDQTKDTQDQASQQQQPKKSLLSFLKRSKSSQEVSTKSTNKMPSEFAISGSQQKYWDVSSSRKSSINTYDTSSSIEAGSSRSSVSRAFDMARSKLSHGQKGAELLADNESDFQRQKERAMKKQQREEEYRRLGLDKKVKLGQPGAGSFSM